MANSKKGSWKKERASVKSGGTRSKSNKYRPEPADQDKRPESGSASTYWRAGYTRRDGTEVKGHYVKKSR